MNATRLIAITALALTLGAAGLSSAATVPGSSSVQASVNATLTMTVTAGATLNIGAVAPGACGQLGDLALNNRPVTLTITSNVPWNVSFASSHATGRLVNGAAVSTNPLQFQAGTLAGSTPFSNMTSAPVDWFVGLQPATASAQVFGAIRWCAAATEPAGTYTGTINYLATAP